MPARTIFLRQTFFVQKLRITDGAEIGTADARELQLEFSPYTDEEKRLGHNTGGAVDTRWTCKAPPKGYAALVKYSAKELNTVRHGHSISPHFDDLPGPLREFGRGAIAGIAEVVSRRVCALRWRMDIEIPHQFLSVGMPEWSDDKVTWRPFPVEFMVRSLGDGSAPRLSRRTAEHAEVAAGLEEPVHHNLIRQAWEQTASYCR